MQVTDSIMQLMGVGRSFKDSSQKINSLDFHRSDDLLVTGSDDDSIRVYDTATATCMATLPSKKYGVCNLCLTQQPSCALYASPQHKVPSNTLDTSWYYLRHHDLQQNVYERYFRGHAGPVTTLAMSPKSDTFLSASMDKTMRLWDLRTTICQGIMGVSGTPCGTFDQQGLVFAVATESGVIKLYDVRSYDKGPFKTFVVQDEANSPSTFTDLRFSSNGKYVLGVVDGRVYVLDAFEGQVLCKFTTGSQERMEAAFSPDSQYVLAGCDDRSIRVWSVQSGQQVTALQGHAGLPTCVKFAPRRLLIASACQSLVLWIPPLQALEQAQPTNKPN